MKYHIFFSIIFIFIILGCSSENAIRNTTCVEYEKPDYQILQICTSDICNEYYNIWKELIQEKNNINQGFFDNHIELQYVDLNSWADGISIRVCYKIKIGWAVVYNCDQFIVKIEKDNALYPTLNLPRNTYLTKENIKFAIEKRAFSSQIAKITNRSDLKFNDKNRALASLIAFSGLNTLCYNGISLDKTTGNLILDAYATYENEENSCVLGTIDLLTGEKKVRDTPCWIN
ncbi:hypothetical protein [Mariniflexile sp.]|uniref:hypothetical protein n=1 Tax=Mariniflexile sp. TaxID=1979402 RepID=UPI004048766E